jgi:phosphoketolase
MTNTDIKRIAEENCMTEDRQKEVSGGHPKNAISAYGTARSTVQGAPLSSEELREIDEYWRASLYLCLGMLYLQDNPLLREPLKIEHVKPRMLGHWGSDAGQTFAYIHFNRLIKKYDLNAIYISGPGHGAPSVLSQAYLEGTYSEIYPEKSEDAAGMQRFFKQFSFPGGIGSHATPETPGSINEGGELGYCISHAYGTVYDHPDLIALTVVGDGEAETGPLATSWHSNKFLNPIRDGAVLPVLHLNGYKINNPTILARISHDELKALFVGYGYTPYFVEGSDHESMHQAMAATLEHCVLEIREIQETARQSGKPFRPRWPMVILRSPKGWTAPRKVDGHYLEGFWRAHQLDWCKHQGRHRLIFLRPRHRHWLIRVLEDRPGDMREAVVGSRWRTCVAEPVPFHRTVRLNIGIAAARADYELGPTMFGEIKAAGIFVGESRFPLGNRHLGDQLGLFGAGHLGSPVEQGREWHV